MQDKNRAPNRRKGVVEADSAPGLSAAPDRAARLAAELRANLKKRKDQARSRAAGGLPPDLPSPPGKP